MYIHKFWQIYEKNVDLFIAPSSFLHNKIIEFGINGKKVVHIPNFIDVEGYSPKYNGENYLVYFGKVSGEKGLFTLVQAMRNIKTSKLLIIGEGELKKDLEKYILQKNIVNVKFLGHIKGERLKTAVRNSQFAILPSEWYENCPYSILEAFALGKPVIGSDIGGIPELIEDGIDGLLFEPGNSEELSEKITYLIGRPGLRERMGRNARKKVEEKYNPEVYYQRLMGVYQKLLR